MRTNEKTMKAQHNTLTKTWIVAALKGRVDFFLSYQTRCRCLGVEYDERIYEKAIEN